MWSNFNLEQKVESLWIYSRLFLYLWGYFSMSDSIGKSSLKLVGLGGSLFLLKVVDHEINYIGWVLVDNLDHHPAQYGIDILLDIL